MASYRIDFDRAQPANVTKLKDFLTDKALCEVLASEFKSPNGARPVPATIKYMPWVVPVVGSGALDSVGSWEIDLDRLLADVEQVVENFGEAPEGSELFTTIAVRFVESLVKGRRRTEPKADGGQSARVAMTPAGARLVLVTALLTRYVHVARAMGPTALDRSNDEIIEAKESTSSLDDPYQLATTIRLPLLDQLSFLMSELQGDEKFGALVTLLAAVRDGLNRPERSVSLNSLRLMTEATWVKLVDRPDAYYGWSELMLKLFLESNSGGTVYAGSDGGNSIRLFDRRPRYGNLAKVGETVRAAFDGPTQASWRSGNHSQIHDAVAQVLISQAAQSGKLENLDLPRALAISTAFDLELEMALWRAGSKFQIAIPLHAHARGQAELVWMVGTIDPSGPNPENPLEAIRDPQSWIPLSKKRFVDMYKDLPLVVRATGCPLIRIRGKCTDEVLRLVLPQVSSEPSAPDYAFDETDTAESISVSHAVSVDEYLAIRLAEAEIQRTYQSQRADQSHREVADIGQAFAKGSKNPFFFAFFGVPFGDPAVRQRLMSLLTVRWVRRSQVDGSPRGGRPFGGDPPRGSGRDEEPAGPNESEVGPSSLSGIAINTRLNLEEASLLSWLGLSVVHGDCSGLVSHLIDYAHHVSDEHGVCHPMQMGTCTLRDQS